MGTIELNSDLHKILNRIENEQLLRTFYDFLKQSETAKEGQIRKALYEEQKKEVYLTYEESREDKNLIDWETVKKKMQYYPNSRAKGNYSNKKTRSFK